MRIFRDKLRAFISNLKKIQVLQVYIIISIVFVGIFVISRTICAYPQIFSGDDRSARYLLSGIGQAMAAIFAFAFTIPLIAIQIAASKYSSRIFKFFFNRWIILFMFFFLVLILFPFLILSKIESNIPTLFIDIDLVITGLFLFLLIPYFISTKEYLKPETLVKKLEKDNRDIISKIKSKNREIKAKEIERLSNNVITLHDLAKICIRDVDTPTLQITVRSILTLMIESELNETLRDIRDTASIYFKELVENTLRIGSTKMLTMTLYSVLESEFNAGYTKITKKAINALYHVGMYSLEYDKRKDAEAVCQALISATNLTLLKNLDLALMSTSFCNAIGLSALRSNEPELTYEWFSTSFGKRVSQQTIMEVVASDLYFIECAAWEKGNLKIAREAIDELRVMGEEGLHNEKPKIAINAIDKLYEIINMTVPTDAKIKENDLVDIYKDIVNAISLIVRYEPTKEIEVKEKAAEIYYKIASEMITSNNPEIVKEAGVEIGRIGLNALRGNISEFAEQIVDYLTPICMKCLEIKEAPEIVSKLLCIGAMTKKKDERNLEDKVKKSITELFKLTKKNKLEGFFDRTVELAKKENKEDKLQIEKFLEGIDY